MQPGGRAKNGARKRATGSQMKIELGRPVTRFVRSGTRLHVCKNAGNVLPGPRWNPPGTRLHVCLIPPHLGPGHTFFGRRKNGGNVLPGPRWNAKTKRVDVGNVLPGPRRFGAFRETCYRGPDGKRGDVRPKNAFSKRISGSHMGPGNTFKTCYRVPDLACVLPV